MVLFSYILATGFHNVITHPSQCNSSGSQTDESAISSVWLMDGVGIVMAELMHNLGDSVVVVVGQRITDRRLESAVFVCQL